MKKLRSPEADPEAAYLGQFPGGLKGGLPGKWRVGLEEDDVKFAEIKFIRKACVNLSDEELNSIKISYYYEYTKYRFPSNEFAFNPEFAQHNINHSHIIWHYYHLNHSQFKKIPF